MKSLRTCLVAALTAALFAFAPPPAWSAADAEPERRSTSLERRERLLDICDQQTTGAIPDLTNALQDPSPFVRRTAAHLLVRLGAPASAALRTALQNQDFHVRLIALRGLAAQRRLPQFLGPLLQDEHPAVRRDAQRVLNESLRAGGDAGKVLFAQLLEAYDEAPAATRAMIARVLAATTPLPERAIQLLLKATGDPAVEVREAAFHGLIEGTDPASPLAERTFAAAATDESLDIREWAFQQCWERRAPSTPKLQNCREVDRVPLPAAGWRFSKDQKRMGHRQEWFATGYDDRDWTPAGIQQFWDKFIGDNYEGGVGWYRRQVMAPEVPKNGIVTLHFSGVDEMTWVWVNGRYAGHHNIGPSGWDTPFEMDVTGLLETGRETCIAVRVLNTAYAGGIWGPVRFSLYTCTDAAN